MGFCQHCVCLPALLHCRAIAFFDAMPPATFKNIFRLAGFRVAWIAVLLGIGAAGCRTATPLPPANFAEPGWTVRSGQALWRAKRDAPEIAGEILVATNATGETVVQFTKTPFPMVVARTAAGAWQLDAPAQNRRYTFRGAPPGRS